METAPNNRGRFLAVVATLQLFVGIDEHIEALCWGVPVKGFPGPAVELDGGGHEVVGGVNAQVSALRKVLSEQAVRVFI